MLVAFTVTPVSYREVANDAMSMVHNDPTTGASSGLAITHEVSIDIHIKYFIRGGVHGLGATPSVFVHEAFV